MQRFASTMWSADQNTWHTSKKKKKKHKGKLIWQWERCQSLLLSGFTYVCIYLRKVYFTKDQTTPLILPLKFLCEDVFEMLVTVVNVLLPYAIPMVFCALHSLFHFHFLCMRFVLSSPDYMKMPVCVIKKTAICVPTWPVSANVVTHLMMQFPTEDIFLSNWM